MKVSVSKRGITCSSCLGKRRCQSLSLASYCVLSSCPLTKFGNGELIDKEIDKTLVLDD
ncbi:MAG: hypothetical protein QNJ60_06120 [Xenococcaceae cyanobacterium MO_188.B19]|nr:hypothetical protein [Xenococcaceae cyanobacterium MO_188.B19]